MIGLCMNQKDKLHIYIQLFVDLILLYKIIWCQSSHGGNVIHAWPHSIIFKLVHKHILPLTEKAMSGRMQFARNIMTLITLEYDTSGSRVSSSSSRWQKEVILDMKWLDSCWNAQRMIFIHLKMFQDLLCIGWLMNKNSILNMFNLQA